MQCVIFRSCCIFFQQNILPKPVYQPFYDFVMIDNQYVTYQFVQPPVIEEFSIYYKERGLAMHKGDWL